MAAALVALLSGCASEGGDGTPTDADSRDSVESDAGADPSPVEDGVADGGSDGVDGAVDSSAGDGIVGGVTVFEVRAPSVAQLERGGIAAGFVIAEETTTPEPVATVGECVVTEVDPNTSLFPDRPSLDAGDITVGLGDETFTLRLQPGEDGPRYASDAPDERIEFFSAGLTIRYAAQGGAAVPAFEGTVSAPAEPVISSPAWSGVTGGTHSASQDLSVGWTATGVGDAVISLVPIEILPEPGVADGNAITCVVPDSGTYAVPAEALAFLPEGAAFGPNVALTTVVAVNRVLTVGEAEVTLNATASHTIVGAIR